MKSLSLALVALWCTSTSLARADDEPILDSPAITKAQGWMKAMLAPGGAVATPSKEQPLDYVVVTSAKPCKAMKTGTASEFKAAGKLKTCLVAAYKAISKNRIEAQWSELRATDLAQVVGTFPATYKKKITAGAKGATIVSGHYPGDGLNLDVHLAVADGRVRAIWVSEEAFE